MMKGGEGARGRGSRGRGSRRRKRRKRCGPVARSMWCTAKERLRLLGSTCVDKLLKPSPHLTQPGLSCRLSDDEERIKRKDSSCNRMCVQAVDLGGLDGDVRHGRGELFTTKTQRHQVSEGVKRAGGEGGVKWMLVVPGFFCFPPLRSSRRSDRCVDK